MAKLRLKFLVFLVVFIFLNSKSLEQQSSKINDQILIQINNEQQNQNDDNILFIKRPKINQKGLNTIVPTHILEKRDSIVNNNQLRIAFIEKLKNSDQVKFIEKVLIRNKNGLKVLFTLTAVLLMRIFYDSAYNPDGSNATFFFQSVAGITLAEYTKNKKWNLFLMGIFYEILAYAIFIGSVKVGFSTGLSTVCDNSFLYSILFYFTENLDHLLNHKEKSNVVIEEESDEKIIVPTRFKNNNNGGEK